ncbi:MAG: penicillin acylase family protein [Aquimonas sp.]|nr:penicillin acylase family protein [Aquimonas sp.]
MKKFILAGLALAMFLLLAVPLAAWMALQASVPQIEGRAALPGLGAEVRIERDSLGVATLHANSAADAARALGFLHAQENFLGMDLARRTAAGELAELLGPMALPRDRENRPHRLRARSVVALDDLNEIERSELRAYVEGANAGLAALRARPWPYLILRSRPEPWREEDSLLVGLAMFFELQDAQNRRELRLLQLRAHLPDALVDLLASPGSELDAPLFGKPWPALSPEALAAALRGQAADAALQLPDEEAASLESPSPGSNNFAVAGNLTADGRALVADDMHLGLRAPGFWYRVRLIYPDPRGVDGRVDASGVSLPGVPAIVVGSNGHVAWGFTNSYGDWHDWVAIDWIDAETGRYHTPEGMAEVELHRETLAVRGGESEILEVRQTRWGPILARSPDGQDLALLWTAHRRGAIDLGMGALLHAADIDQALDIAQRSGTPVQNFVGGDASGRIGWTLMGRLPQRLGDCDPLQPLRPLHGCDWAPDWLDPSLAPILVDPPHGRLWTANSRVVDDAGLALIGDGGYDLGARQRQIRDALFARERFSEADLLALQLEDRAVFMQGWWERLRSVLERPDRAPELAALEAATRERPDRASVDSVSYRAARGFRALLIDALQAQLYAPVREALDDEFAAPRTPQFESVLQAYLQLSEETLPEGWPLPEDLQASAAAGLAEDWQRQGSDFSQRNWGERNTSVVCHPLADALPEPLRAQLCMPGGPLPGDNHVPRVQGPRFGASQRMVVAPGREAEGIFHMPGGQSGHPLSPFWGAGHGDWAAGRPSAFLPGPARHVLVLQP